MPEYNHVKFTFNEFVNDIKIDEGDTVSPNIIVASLIDASSLDLYVEVRSDVIEGLKLNMEIEVSSNGIISKGKLISFQTSPNLETNTHLLRIRITENQFRSGMIASATFILPEINESFGVPVSSVLNDDGRKYIFLVKDKKLIKIDIDSNNIQLIKSGLRKVVESGTGVSINYGVSNLPPVSGKTGTAEDGEGGLDHAWFVCFTPSEKSELLVVAFAQNTPGGGSVHALPMAREILKVWNEKK